MNSSFSDGDVSTTKSVQLFLKRYIIVGAPVLLIAKSGDLDQI